MKVLVTGSRGFIGRHVVKLLRQRNHHVIDFDYALGHNVRSPTVPANIDVIVHLAAVLRSTSDRISNYLYTVNVEGTVRLLEEAILKGTPRLIFASSAAVYEGLTLYAASKISGEAYCRAVSDKIDTKIIRLFNVYGPGQSAKSGALIPKVLSSLYLNEPLEIHGDGTQTRDFVYVADVAKLILDEVDNYILPTGIPVDAGTGVETSVLQVLDYSKKAYYKVHNIEPTLSFEFSSNGRQPMSSVASPGIAMSRSIKTSIEDGLYQTVKFWKDTVVAGGDRHANS